MEQQLTMLIVDDEAAIRNGLSAAINWAEHGITIIGTAMNGNEAAKMIDTFHPHIVITDIKMPEKDGLALIRDEAQKGRKTKFIILSGYDDFKYAQTAIRYGVWSYLLKPIKKHELLEIIKDLKKEILSEISEKLSVQEIKKMVKKNNHVLKEFFFIHLLENEYENTAEILYHMDQLNLKIQNKQNIVIVFHYHMTTDDNEIFSMSDNRLFQSAAMNVIEEILTNFSSVTFPYGAFDIISIINIEKEPFDIHPILQHICNTIHDYYRIPLYAAIGCPVPDLTAVNQSYKMALEALSYQLYETSQRVFDPSIIDTAEIPLMDINDIDNTPIVDAIYRGDAAELHRLLHDFFHSLFYTSTPAPHYIRGMCIYLVVDIQKTLSVYIPDDEQLFNKAPFDVINQLHSFRIIRRWIEEEFTSYMNFLQNGEVYKKNNLLDNALSYIRRNLHEKLNAKDVAGFVGLSENYFTVYFKKKMHQNFKNYVLHAKIEYAKELLKEPDRSIADVSVSVGYEDYHSFHRAFKKIVGMPPSEYMKQYRK